MTFQAADWAVQANAEVRFFTLLSPHHSEGRIVFSDKLGPAALYDADANCVTTMPAVAAQLGCRPITISLARPGAPDLEDDDLYVMHTSASTGWDDCGGCFGVLRFGDRRPDATLDIRRKAWCWDRLPSPPLGPCTPISSHAVVDGGRTICISAESVPGYGPTPDKDGTYCFDTVRREWKRSGDWVLPFEGGAEHVHVSGGGDVWLGFADFGRNLCAASGLSGAMETAPVFQHVWRDAGKVPVNWSWRPMSPRLVDLGGGRFYIAKTCIVMPHEDYEKYSGLGIEVAVLTGGGDRPPRSIDIVEHKSLGYIPRGGSIRWVL